MNTAFVVDPSSQSTDRSNEVREQAGVERVVRLLRVYRNKLVHLISEYEITPDKPAMVTFPSKQKKNQATVKQFRPLRPAVTRLARYASGLIENTTLSEIDKIELQLRLVEMEAALDAASTLIR